MTDKHIELLIHQYLDGTVRDSGVMELRQAIEADAGNLRLLFRRAEEQADLVAVLREEALEKSGVTVEKAAPKSQRAAVRLTWWRPVLAWAAGLMIATGFFMGYLRYSQGRGGAVIAGIRSSAGEVLITRGNKIMSVTAGLPVREGDHLAIPADGHVVIDYLAEATSLEAQGETALKLWLESGAKRVYVGQGKVVCDVAKQPEGRPMIFLTPHAEATVLGTRLVLEVKPSSSQLAVEEGAVQFKRVEDPDTLEVRTGQKAVAGEGIPFTVRPLQDKPVSSAIPVLKGPLYTLTREEVDAFFDQITEPAQVEHFSRQYLAMEFIHVRPDAYGRRPLELKRAGLNPNDIKSYDITKINKAYFDHIQHILTRATNLGIPVALFFDAKTVKFIDSADADAIRVFGEQIAPYYRDKKILHITGSGPAKAKVQLLWDELRKHAVSGKGGA